MAESAGLRTDREEIVRRHIEAERNADAQGVVATFTTPRYDIAAIETVVEGAEGVAFFINDTARTMPRLSIEILALHHADDAVILETRMRGSTLARSSAWSRQAGHSRIAPSPFFASRARIWSKKPSSPIV